MFTCFCILLQALFELSLVLGGVIRMATSTSSTADIRVKCSAQLKAGLPWEGITGGPISNAEVEQLLIWIKDSCNWGRMRSVVSLPRLRDVKEADLKHWHPTLLPVFRPGNKKVTKR